MRSSSRAVLIFSRGPRVVIVDSSVVPCGGIRVAVGMSDRGAKALTDEDAKLFIGNLSYHVSNLIFSSFRLREGQRHNLETSSSIFHITDS